MGLPALLHDGGVGAVALVMSAGTSIHGFVTKRQNMRLTERAVCAEERAVQLEEKTVQLEEVASQRGFNQLRSAHIVSLARGELSAEHFTSLRISERTPTEQIGADLHRWSERTMIRARSQQEFDDAARYYRFNNYHKIEFLEGDTTGTNFQMVERYPGAKQELEAEVKQLKAESRAFYNSPFASAFSSSTSALWRTPLMQEHIQGFLEKMKLEQSLDRTYTVDVEALRKKHGFKTNQKSPAQGSLLNHDPGDSSCGARPQSSINSHLSVNVGAAQLRENAFEQGSGTRLYLLPIILLILFLVRAILHWRKRLLAIS